MERTPPKRFPFGCALRQEPEGSLLASVAGTQAISTVCGTQKAASERTFVGRFLGIYTDVGPQKLKTSGRQK